jgi:erythromycin esterase-like protein
LDQIPDARVIGIGDSFTVNHEVIPSHVALIRRLRKDRDFDLVLVESSPLDAWLAMDVMLQGRFKDESFRLARQRGFPPSLQVRELDDLLAFIDEKKKTDQWVYLAGYGTQVASSSGWKNTFIERTFAQALKSYGLRSDEASIEKELSVLTWLKTCSQTGFPRDAADTEKATVAIRGLKSMIDSIIPNLNKRYPDIPHSKALELIPSHLENALLACTAKQEQDRRSEISAKTTLMSVLKVSKSQKAVILGDLANMRYSHGKSPVQTLGNRLKKSLKENYFTIGTFVLRGTVIENLNAPKVKTFIGNESKLQYAFRSQKQAAFGRVGFLDSQQKSWSFAFVESPVPAQAGRTSFILKQDLDAIILFPKVSRTRLWESDYLIGKNKN